MEIAIREMDGRELGERPISVNKAQPRGGGEDSNYAYPSGGGGRVSYGGGDRFSGEDCYNCGRSGHRARDCTLSGGGGRGRGGFSSLSGFGGGRGRGGRFGGGDRDRYIEDRYDGGRYGDRDRYESREKYAPRERFVPDRYPPSGDRFVGGDRYGGPDRYPENGFGKGKGYEREIVTPRIGAGDRYGGGGGGDRYGSGGGGPTRYEGKSYRDRPAPYDRPRREGGRPSSYDDRY